MSEKRKVKGIKRATNAKATPLNILTIQFWYLRFPRHTLLETQQFWMGGVTKGLQLQGPSSGDKWRLGACGVSRT